MSYLPLYKKVRQTMLLAFLLISLQGYGQIPDSISWTLEGRLQDSTVGFFELCTASGYCNYVLKSLSGQQWDTLIIFSEYDEDENFRPESIELKAIQIDGKGLKEIVISCRVKSYGVYQGEWSYELNQIWNLDSRQKIFSALSSYYSYAYNDHLCEYSYVFKVNNNGHITIGNVKTNYRGNYKSICSKPDHQKGTYIFKNGVFKRF